MSTFEYQGLPDKPNLTRMLLLLPQENREAPVECELVEYDLAKGGHQSQNYEALSYCWESEKKPDSVTLCGHAVSVTKNLNMALKYLRDPQLKRALWIDAICINQEDTDEKSRQIPLMRQIYAQASQVIVWLGGSHDGGDKALERICYFGGQDESTSDPWSEQDASLCSKLLDREWFRRMWVLQEVGVARSISIICGSTQISGHSFCQGLARMKFPPDCHTMAGAVAHLMKGAPFRPRSTMRSEGLSLAESIGLYCKHHATQQHDKIYALLGLATEEEASQVQVNYQCDWHDLLKTVAQHIFCTISVQIWKGVDYAIIKSKALVLGFICKASKEHFVYGRQSFTVVLNKTSRDLGYDHLWQSDWILGGFEDSIQDGDFIWILQGASKPTVVRLCGDHFTVILPAMPQKDVKVQPSEKGVEQNCPTFPDDVIFTWELPRIQKAASTRPAKLVDKVSSFNYHESQTETKSRLSHIKLAVVDLMSSENATEAIKNIITLGCPECVPLTKIAIHAAKELEGSGLDIAKFLFQCHGNKYLVSNEVVQAAVRNTGRYGSGFMQFLFESCGESLLISDQVIQAAAANYPHGSNFMEVLFKNRGEKLPISEKVVQAAAANSTFWGSDVMKCLFENRGEKLPISDQVVQAAAANLGPKGNEIMQILFNNRGEKLPVSSEVVQAAAANLGPKGNEIMQILFNNCGEKLPISDQILQAAAANSGNHGFDIMQILSKSRGGKLAISSEVVQAAAANSGSDANRIMQILFDNCGENLPIFDKVVQLAAANIGYTGYSIMQTLFENRGEKLPVSDKVVQLAAANRHDGARIMKVLFENRGEKLPISDQVFQAAAANSGIHGFDIMQILLENRREKLPVSDQVFQAAAANSGMHGFDIMQILLENRREKLPVSDKVVQLAAANLNDRARLMQLLFDNYGENLPICDKFVQSAAAHIGYTAASFMKVLFENRGEKLPVSDKVVQLAATNRYSGARIMKILFENRGEKLPVSDKVVQLAAANRHDGAGIMKVLLENRGEKIPVSDKVVQLAATNRYSGARIMKILFENRGEKLPVSDKVVQLAAASTERAGNEIMVILFENRGEKLSISDKVVQAAAANPEYGLIIMHTLLQNRGATLPISDTMVQLALANHKCGQEILKILVEHYGEKHPMFREVEWI